jgi:tRNA pseudouridine32 synthase / 23S rRNA pseudouridine746 synthase
LSALPSTLTRAMAYAPPADRGLQIIYQDDHLLVIDKPAGLLSVPGRSADLHDCALHRAQARFAHALLVHRLDEATSGLLVFALSALVQKRLSLAFENRQVQKSYLAWVHGLDLPSHGLIDAPIALDWPRRPLRIIDQQRGQSAITRFSLLSKNEHSTQSLCCLEPQTGRTHQLRVHMRHIGHPIVGDCLYGLANDPATRLMLHAHRLEFAHPVDSTRHLSLESPAPF